MEANDPSMNWPLRFSEYVSNLEALQGAVDKLAPGLTDRDSLRLSQLLYQRVFAGARELLGEFLPSLSEDELRHLTAAASELRHRPGGLGDSCDAFRREDLGDTGGAAFLDDAGLIRPIRVVFDLRDKGGGSGSHDVIYERVGERSYSHSNPLWNALDATLGFNDGGPLQVKKEPGSVATQRTRDMLKQQHEEQNDLLLAFAIFLERLSDTDNGLIFSEDDLQDHGFDCDDYELLVDMGILRSIGGSGAARGRVFDLAEVPLPKIVEVLNEANKTKLKTYVRDPSAADEESSSSAGAPWPQFVSVARTSSPASGVVS